MGKNINHHSKIAVIGAGSWGTTFAKVLSDAGSEVVLFSRREEVAREVNQAKRNSEYLPRINLPRNLHATSQVELAIEGASQIYFAVPSQSVRKQVGALKKYISDEAIVVSLMKGVEKKSGLRMSQILEEVLEVQSERIAVVSGPNLAYEIAKEEPTAAVVSSENIVTAQHVAAQATNVYFKCFTNTDVVGTEFAGILKNLIALAIGIVDGVGYGQNTKASILTRGLVEMTDFAVAHGAMPQTLTGLAGLGDLIATCESPLSRNNTAGRLLGQGYTLADVVSQMNQTAEGLASVKPILELAYLRGVSMPIVSQVSQVLDGTLAPRDLAPHLATDEDIPLEEHAQHQQLRAIRSFMKKMFGLKR